MYPSGCGVFIDTSTSCTTLGGYFEDPVLSNFWTNERFTTSESTSDGFFDGDFQGLLETGATDVGGHAFVGK
jgi:hypothetical protein